MLGMVVTHADKESVTAKIVVSPELCTTGGIMHGGAIMGVADSLGAIAAFLNLPKGANGTTTIESKTNFLGAAPLESKVVAKTAPVKIGSRLSVWQTELLLDSGRHVALVTQTQLVL